ncbi:outer membrane lipoprotein carrier protein LolA [Acidobacteriota bacterium]
MKKYLTILLAGVLLLGISAFTLYSQDSDDAAKKAEAKKIVEKLIEAQGGRDVLSKIRDMTSTGDIELIQFGMSGSVTMYQKEPDKMRMDMEIMGMVITQAYDGETAWMTNPQTGANEEMPEELASDTRRQSLGNDAILNPEKLGITYTFEGKETIEGTEYLILKQTFSDGKFSHLYIDPGTYLVYKTKETALNQMGVEVEAESFMSDYKDFQGTKVPYTITVYQDGEEFIIITLSTMKYNTGLEDTLFKMGG